MMSGTPRYQIVSANKNTMMIDTLTGNSWTLKSSGTFFGSEAWLPIRKFNEHDKNIWETIANSDFKTRKLRTSLAIAIEKIPSHELMGRADRHKVNTADAQNLHRGLGSGSE